MAKSLAFSKQPNGWQCATNNLMRSLIPHERWMVGVPKFFPVIAAALRTSRTCVHRKRTATGTLFRDRSFVLKAADEFFRSTLLAVKRCGNEPTSLICQELSAALVASG